MAEQSHVKTLVLTHLIPSIPDESEIIQEFTAGMEKSSTGHLIVASDGDEITAAIDPATQACMIQFNQTPPFSVQRIKS